MARYDFALLTDSRYVAPTTTDTYVQHILYEDELLTRALATRGLTAIRVDWADRDFAWQNVKAAVFRTTWDYFNRFAKFSAWLTQTSRLVTFINPYSLIQWNLDKHYLLDLQRAGVNIPETIFVEQGEYTTLKAVVDKKGWREVIIKPAISGAARHTYRVAADKVAGHEAVFQQLIAGEAMMVQPFQRSVLSRGEVALMYFGGTYSHAVLKVAKPGDFRVQDDFGGTIHPYQPTAAEIALGTKAMQACSPTPVYGRVDIIEDNDGRPAVSEVELIEPELWFRMHPEAAGRMAEALAGYLDKQ